MNLSLIITCHNQHKYFFEMLSVLQKYIDFEKEIEVIVVDSSTEELLPSKFYQYYHISNKGPSFARNFGILKATKTWIKFCDADDIPNPLVLKYISAVIDPKSDASFFNFRRVENDFMLEEAKNFFKKLELPLKPESITISDPVFFLERFFPVHSVIFNRSVFSRIKFNESQWFIEDVRLYIELTLLKNIKINYYLDPAFVSFHRNYKFKQSLSTSNEELFWDGVCSNYQYVAKHTHLIVKQKFRLLKLVVSNYHSVTHSIQDDMLKKNRVLWNYCFGLAHLLRNRKLFNLMTTFYRIGK